MRTDDGSIADCTRIYIQVRADILWDYFVLQANHN